ncbi:MAG: hypothetical protein ABSA44_12285 [Bacteroidota bacterium]|jgi:hypothetical protein
MHNKFSPLFLFLVTAILAVFSFSCEKNNPVENGKPQLTASENPVTVAVSWQKYITISGGQGPCSVKSVSDSSVVNASIDRFSYPYGRTLSLLGTAIGTAIIVVQDSAQTAEIQISVTVATIAASPSNVTVQVQSSQYVSLQGGTYPYTIDQPTNSILADASVSGSSVYIEGVAPGSTTLVVRDNANPPNKVTISITVIPKPVLTTPGKISFTSSVGGFSADGILPDNLDNIAALPANSEGAGGTIYISSPGTNVGTIVGYKKHSQNIVDVVAIVFVKSNLSQGVLPIDSSLALYGVDTALVEFVFGGDLNSQTADMYLMHSGTLTFTALSAQKATGTFSGAATLIRNDIPVAGSNTTVTNGSFDVPLLQDNLGLTAQNLEQQRIIKFVQKIIEYNLMKVK